MPETHVDPVTSTSRGERQLSRDEGQSITKLSPPPAVSAKGWLVYDAGSDEPVAGQDAARPRPIASLAKLMTALLVVERTQPDDVVTIPASINSLAGDASIMGARPGEKWTVRNLLRAMLVYSANDAALALAAHVSEGDIPAFVKLMNDRGRELGLTATEFASPTGLDAPGATSTSTPIDLVTLAATVLRDPAVHGAVAERRLTLQRPGGGAAIVLPNRNPLLGSYAGVDGVKTGHTDSAGYMLVVHHHDEETDGELFVATFASSSEATRVSDAKALLDWARSLRTQVRVVEGGAPLGTIPVQRSDERLHVFACDDLVVGARPGQRVRVQVIVPRSVAAPIREGNEVGTLHVRIGEAHTDPGSGIDSTTVPSVPICSGESIRRHGRLDRFRSYAKDYRRAWRLGSNEAEDAWSSLRKHVA